MIARNSRPAPSAARSDTPGPIAPGVDSLAYRRVLVASESLGPVNGVTRATEQLLAYLHRQRVDVAAVAPQWSGDHSPVVPEDVPCLRLGGLPLPYNPELRIVTPFRLRRIMQALFRPEMIYLASPASLGIQLWRQARADAIPMVANFQTDLAAYARLCLPAALSCPAGRIADRLHAMLYGDPVVRAVLCPSSASREYLLDLGVPAGKIHLVRRGVDCTLFDARKRSRALRGSLAPNGEVLLLCVSRLSIEKGFDFLAAAYDAALRQARERRGCPKFRLIVTGGNANPAIAHTIRRSFAARGLDVYFTGTLTGEALATMYASADIFVFPSRTETFGQVIQEAMASGLPVVAQREGGPADLVRPGVTGYLANPGDGEDFARRILDLIEDADKRMRISFTARAIAEKRSWDAVNARIADIMATALAECAPDDEAIDRNTRRPFMPPSRTAQ